MKCWVVLTLSQATALVVMCWVVLALSQATALVVMCWVVLTLSPDRRFGGDVLGGFDIVPGQGFGREQTSRTQ